MSVIEKMKNLSDTYGSKKNIIFFVLSSWILYFIMVFYSIPAVSHFSNGLQILDMMPIGYDAEYVRILFQVLGPSGREAYLYTQLPLDMVYPMLFGIGNALFLSYIFTSLFNKPERMNVLRLLPIIGAGFDYLENIGIAAMLFIYPTFYPDLATVVSVFTILKSLFVMCTFVVMIVAMIALTLRYVRSSRNKR